ncbi:MAG: hypothetical protein ACR2NU_16320, partial [Aeoliella sp.]
VLALAIGMGYLWQAEMLTSDKMFHVSAVLHGVDLEAIANEAKTSDREVPAEETSLDDVARLREIKLRNYEVKQNALKLTRQEFDHSLRQISEATERFDQNAKELESRLRQHGELSSKENLAEVVNQLQAIKPQQAKDLLFMFLEEDEGEKDMILLLKAMQKSKRDKILQQFKLPDELVKLQRIQRLMLAGYPEKPEIDKLLEKVRLPPDSGP